MINCSTTTPTELSFIIYSQQQKYFYQNQHETFVISEVSIVDIFGTGDVQTTL